MSKSSDLAQSSARGGFNILWGMMFSAIISAVGTIIVGNALGEDFGLISIVLSGPLMINSIRDLGINQSIIKYANQYRAENNAEKLKNIVLVGTSFNVILGLVFTITSFLLSGVMANILERPTLVPLIQIASLMILAEALLKTVHAVLIGYEKMALHSLTLVIQAILKTSLMVFLVVMSFGVYGALIGQIIGYSATGLVSFALLYFVIIAKLRKHEFPFHFLSTIKTMLTFGVPLSIVTILSGVLVQFFVFMTAIYASDLMISNYAMAINFGTLVGVLATSVATVMFPTFSKIQGHDDPQTLQSVFQYSVKYTSLLVVPLTFAVIALSNPGVEALFQNKFEYTPLFMSLYVLTFLYAAIGNLSAGSLIKSQGKTQVNMKVMILTFIVGIVLSMVLIPSFQVVGLLIAHIFSGLPGLIISLWWINKNYDATVDWLSSIKIVGISAFSAALTYFVINQLNLTSWIGLLVGAPVFLGTYVVAAPLVGAITYVDTKYLKDAVKSLGPLAIVIDTLLYPIEKIAKSKQKTKT